MDVKRETLILEGSQPSTPEIIKKSKPFRIVVDHDKVRKFFDSELKKAHDELGLDEDIQLMPYVLLAEEKYYKMAVTKGYFRISRLMIEVDHPDDSFASIFKGYFGASYTYALREYGLCGTGILFEGRPQGRIECRKYRLRTDAKDILIPVVGEAYGSESGEQAQLFSEGRKPSDVDDGIASLDSQVWKEIEDAENKSIVVLGPPDDVVGIMKDNYVFRENKWVPR